MDVPLLTLNKLNPLQVFKIMYIRRGNDGLNAFMNELQQIVPSRLVSSLNTSSNSNKGYSPTSDLMNSNSLSFSESTAVRCCPWDPISLNR